MNTPLISIVTGTYNRLELLQRMVESVRVQIPRGVHVEFVVCDGGSTDGTLDWLKGQSDVTLLEHGELRGAITAFTEAAHLARGKYVVLANDDVEFRGSGLLRAVYHLETHPKCGAVAFADNRGKGKNYGVMSIRATRDNGAAAGVPYAQVGMFRRWLGERLNWWRGHDERFAGARTYGGDNLLSANIWQSGYTVDAVDGAYVHDFIADDDMRKVNGASGEIDAQAYYSVYPANIGPIIPPEPTIQNQDKQQLRILYLPLFEQGHTVQRQQKRGLRDALAKVGLVYELDYISHQKDIRETLTDAVESWMPHLLLMQIGAGIVTPELLSDVRLINPRMVVVNWYGDYHESGLTTPAMFDLLKYIDLQLVANASALPVYEQRGVPAAYWQIGYEEPGDELPEMPAHDVVWLANVYNDGRRAVQAGLNELDDVNVGVYQFSSGTLYDFAKGKALYQNARIAIGTNEFADGYGFVSNRLFQAMAAGGCLMLYQHVPGLEEHNGIIPGKHMVEWSDVADLREKIGYYLTHEEERRRIADAGTAFVRENFSFDAQVRKLFQLLPLAKQKQNDRALVEYTGRNIDQFGYIGPHTRQQYTVNPGRAFVVHRDDLQPMLIREPHLWREVAYGS